MISTLQDIFSSITRLSLGTKVPGELPEGLAPEAEYQEVRVPSPLPALTLPSWLGAQDVNPVEAPTPKA